MNKITTLEQLQTCYDLPVTDRARWKEIDHLSEQYRRFIGASPFLILATCSDNGIDCTPRGDPAGFVRIVDDRHLQIPDRRGNNRLDSLRNIIRNPWVGLIFLVPNVGETIRVSGSAEILIDDDLCASFAVNGKPAQSVLSIEVHKAYYQCQKALVRSGLWDSSTYPERCELPSAGQMAQYFSAQHGVDFDGDAYDRDYDEYMKQNIY